MGILYTSSRPSKHRVDHGGFGDEHEISCASVAPRYRRTFNSGAASVLHHSIPLVICRIGLVRDAEHQQLPRGLAKPVKVLEGSEENRNRSDGISAVSATTIVGGGPRSSDTGARSHDDTSIVKINQSRLGARYGSPVSGGAANFQSEPFLQPAEDLITIQRRLLDELIKFVVKECFDRFIEELIKSVVKECFDLFIKDFIVNYSKAFFRALVKVFVKHFSIVPSGTFIDDILSGLDDEIATGKIFSDRPITETHREEHKPTAHPIEDKIDPAQVPLPPSPNLTPLKNRPRVREHAAALVTSSFEKRPRDEADEDITELSLCIKKARSRKQKFAISVQRRDANSKDFAFTAEASDRTSKFDSSREDRDADHNRSQLTYILGWSIVDWQSVTFAIRNTRDPHPNAEISRTATIAQLANVRSAPLCFVSIIQSALRQPNPRANSFVSAIQKFNELIPGCNALDRFRKKPDRCLANKDERRCYSWDRLLPSGEAQPIIEKLLADLARLDFDSWPLYCVYSLAIFTNIAVCRYHRDRVRTKVAALRQQQQFDRPYDTDFVKYLPQFLPYRPSESAGLTVNQFVLKVAREPPKAHDEGYLYVYWNEATFGVRKIGFTTKEVSDRLKDWENQCNHVATEQYRSPNKVQYPKKVEELVHADLMHYRVYEPACHTCFKSHIEWFKGVDLPFIIERIEAWSQWISGNPYQTIDGQWRLTPEAEDSIPVVRAPNCCPVAEVQSKSLVNQPRRHNLRRVKGRKPCEKGSPGPSK